METRPGESVSRPGILGVGPSGPLTPYSPDTPDAGSGRPPSATIRGGPTSIHANLDELERGTALLAEAAAEAMALATRAAGWGTLLAIAAQQTALAASLAARTAELSAGLGAIGMEAQVLEHAVGSSAAAYREAEERARRAVQDLAGIPAFIGAAALITTDRPVPQPITDLAVHGAPGASAFLLDLVVPGLSTGFWFTSDVAGRMARDEGRTGPLTGPERLYPLITSVGIMAGVVQIGPVRVRTVDAAEPLTLDGSLTGLMDHLDLPRPDPTTPDTAGPGTIQVTHISPDADEAPDRVWLVGIPGTQGGDHRDATGWSTNPLDVGGNGEAMAFDSQHVALGIDEALKASGAQPGDTVVFTGHSQGGLHAARTAADPRIAGTYDVQGVLTVGSPTGEIALPRETEVLHLEHDQDVAAGADGRSNPQGVHRTTVTFGGYPEGMEPDDPGAWSAHHFDVYRAHVARLEDSPEADLLEPTREHFAALTTGTAVTRAVTLQRTRPGQPRNPLEAGLGQPVSPSGRPRPASPGPRWPAGTRSR